MTIPTGVSAALIALAAAFAVGQPSQRASDATVAYDASGVRVIQRIDTTSEIVVANLYLLGGTRQVTPATAGIEAFLLDATGRGTRLYPKERLRRQMARLGTAIAIDAEEDWTRSHRATHTTSIRLGQSLQSRHGTGAPIALTWPFGHNYCCGVPGRDDPMR